MRRLTSGIALAMLSLFPSPVSAQSPIPPTVTTEAAANSEAAPFFSGRRGSFPGCPQCGVWSWVDYPRVKVDPLDALLGDPPNPTIREDVSASNFWAVGWGFECVSGQPIDRIDVSYEDYEGKFRPLLQPPTALRAGFIARGDIVRFAPSVQCSKPALETGWVLQIHGMPIGLRRVRLEVWWGPYHERQEFILLVKP